MVIIRYLKPSDTEALATIYRACFAEPPWHEEFTQEEVTEDILGVAGHEDSIMAIAEVDGIVIGAAWLFNLHRKPDVLELAKISGVSPYISEIFVSPNARHKGIARALVQEILSKVSNPEYGAVRTSIKQPAIIKLFEKLEWQIVATETVISKKHLDGQIVEAPDTRVILVGSVS